MTPLSLRLYAAATRVLEPLAPMLLRRRAARGKEDLARLGERLGRPTRERPQGKLVWLHGASIGESLSLLPLVERLKPASVIVTTGTLTSARLLAERLPSHAFHQFVPVDAPGAVDHFLDHWRPDLAVFAESELWPNLILGAKRRGIRLCLVSARITEESARGWTRAPSSAKTLLGAFDLILPQDKASAARIAELGGRVGAPLNLKLLADPLTCDEAELARLQKMIGGRPTLVAASTHPGEEEFIAACAEIRSKPLLVIAPRHPDRGLTIAVDLTARGLKVACRSQDEKITPATDVYLADTLGEMGLIFRLADTVIMGGSFVGGVGGHNPLEPARLGRAVITGNDVANFADVYEEMVEAFAVVRTTGCMVEAAANFITDPAAARAHGEAGRAYAARKAREAEAAIADVTAMVPA